MPTQLVPPIRKVLSTWAICSTSPPEATPRLMVSPVALPSRSRKGWATATRPASAPPRQAKLTNISPGRNRPWSSRRSEEHTSELQSPCNLVCRLLLEKKKKKNECNLPEVRDRCYAHDSTEACVN